jgi:prevent-host-death family protein
MICATLSEAKSRLNALVEQAASGEDVILMRGSKHVAAIVPISERNLALCTNLSDAQAQRLWERIDGEIAAGKAKQLDKPQEVLG